MASNIRYYLQTVGICSLMHFLVDGLCVCSLYLLAETMDVTYIVGVFMTYNILAFLTQPLTGGYVDKAKRKHWILLASILLLLLAVFIPFHLFFHTDSRQTDAFTCEYRFIALPESMYHHPFLSSHASDSIF